MATGKTITQICNTEGFPASRTLIDWLATKPSFRERYARAKEITADWHFSRVLEVAEDENITDIQKARLRVDAHKWYAEKLSPRQYGQQKQQVEISGGIDVSVQTLDVRALSIEQREQLKALLIAARDASTMKTIEHKPDDN